MIKTKSMPDEVHGFNIQTNEEGEADGPFEKTKEVLDETTVDSATFENFAMLLNLINNVYIKNSRAFAGSNAVIDEEEDTEKVKIERPYGYVDAKGRFMASSQAEVEKIYHRLFPLMANRRKNHLTKSR